MTSAENRWQSVIDELSADLDRIEAGLEQTVIAVDLGPFRPPSDLPPLPASMVDAALSLSRRHEQLLEVVKSRREAVKPARRPHPVSRGPARFEARA